MAKLNTDGDDEENEHRNETRRGQRGGTRYHLVRWGGRVCPASSKSENASASSRAGGSRQTHQVLSTLMRAIAGRGLLRRRFASADACLVPSISPISLGTLGWGPATARSCR
eukprot:250339-Rhodomonas_salina.1